CRSTSYSKIPTRFPPIQSQPRHKNVAPRELPKTLSSRLPNSPSLTRGERHRGCCESGRLLTSFRVRCSRPWSQTSCEVRLSPLRQCFAFLPLSNWSTVCVQIKLGKVAMYRLA